MDAQAWAEEQFGQCEFNDKRRTQRLVKLAAEVLCHPSGSLPEQTANMADLKAAYRLFACEGVSFEAVVRPHWEQTRRRSPGAYLVLQDTTELDFGVHRHIAGMGQTGNGGGSGFLVHSALVVGTESEEIFGLAAQKIRYRRRKVQKESHQARLNRDRESELWGQVIDLLGPPPEGVRWIHVMDRGADNFEVFCHCLQQRSEWVVRITHKSRKVIVGHSQTSSLGEYLQTLPVAGRYEMNLRARAQSREHGPEPARTAELQVRCGPLHLPFPDHKSPYLKRLSPEPVGMWVVHAREVNVPRDREPIEWVLFTSLPVESFKDAWRIMGYYEKRWLIEEWHKALKTGCRVEHRQLKCRKALERITGVLSVVAVRLLQLKSAARLTPERPARQVVPRFWIQMLIAARRRLKQTTATTMTIREFYRELAKLGGFLGRKSDGEPGWITIWRGWEKLYLLVCGAQLVQTLQ
jgi:hypothetical protein